MVIQIGLQKLNLIGNGDSNWIRNGEQQKMQIPMMTDASEKLHYPI